MEQEIQFLKTAVEPLLGWYRENKRDLPWRHDRTPYTVLVSELMLQQTRVEAVRERYVEFLRRFPTAEALAAASEDEVLKAWEGLGYYTRARNLWKAAKIIAAEGFPRTWVGVRALPGVGDYTAGAVCSVALGLPMPAVDGNVLRILSRLFADGSNVDDPAVRKAYASALAAVYPPEAGEFCEALMELGAIVCVPGGAPLCGKCPWNNLCRAHLAGREENFPVRGEKRARKIVKLNVFVLKCGNEYALKKRGKGLLSGMWEFPNWEGDAPASASATSPSVPAAEVSAPASEPSAPAPSSEPSAPTAEVSAPAPASEPSQPAPAAEVSVLAPSSEGGRGGGVAPELGKVLSEKAAKHVFTHVEWHMTGRLVEVEAKDPRYVWATAEEIQNVYAVPSAFKIFLEWVK